MAETFVNVTEGTGKKLHGWDRTIGANTVQDEFVALGEPPYASYVYSSAVSTATANSHLAQIMAGASLVVRIRRIEIIQSTLATTVTLMDTRLIRLTTAGTGGTGVTPAKLDNADAASGAAGMTLPTVKGTEGTTVAFHSPSMLQTLGASTVPFAPIAVWDFDRPRTKPLIIPAGTANGICVKNVTAVAGGGVIITVWFDETAFAS